MKQETARGALYLFEYGGEDVYTRIAIDLSLSGFEAKRGRTHGEMVAAYKDKVWETIMNWDIRAAGRLRTLFPKHFPTSLRHGPLCIEERDTPAGCHWFVEKEGVP